MNLTVVIPTRNEEVDLPRTLNSLNKLKADILVIDSGSTDNTVQIAKSLNAKVFHHSFKSFSDIRNFGNNMAKTNWILALEADVVVSNKLAQEIKETLGSTTGYNAYFIPRQNIIWGKKINHTDWGPKDDLHIWLYKKDSGAWQGKVHEEYKLEKGTAGYLKNPLIHYNYETVNEFIGKINSYSEAALAQGKTFSCYWPLIDFFKRYIYKKGFLDGYHGLFLSYLQAVYYQTLKIKQHQYHVK